MVTALWAVGGVVTVVSVVVVDDDVADAIEDCGVQGVVVLLLSIFIGLSVIVVVAAVVDEVVLVQVLLSVAAVASLVVVVVVLLLLEAVGTEVVVVIVIQNYPNVLICPHFSSSQEHKSYRIVVVVPPI